MATLVFDGVASGDRVPPLTNRDWLSREEFHRRARNRIFLGLWLEARALLAGDLAAVPAAVGNGLAQG
jgi:hypothetical protein